jgi:archaeosine synthase
MTRIVGGLEGAILFGTATVGPLQLEIPALLEPLSPGSAALPSPPAVGIRGTESASGATRRIDLVASTTELPLEFSVPAPEISGVPGHYEPAHERVGFVRWPLGDADWEGLRRQDPDLIILANARALWQDGRPFVRALAQLRQHVGSRPLLWTPRVGLPHRLAFLHWAGVDIVDMTEGLVAAARGMFLDPALGALTLEARSERACPCPGCQSEPMGSLDAHAREIFRLEHRRVRAVLREGRLRELVEARLTAEPALAEMLRYADRDWGPLLEERTPVVDGRRRNYVLREAQRRPEVRRFLARVRDRYRPPPSKRILLLVPCSRTKPYRSSPSHRRFARAFDELPTAPWVHVVSVSSPLGLVPRELEDVFPARHYDIPVTGEWDEGEQAAVRAALARLLETGAYTQVVLHLDPEEYAFLAASVPDRLRPRWTVLADRPTSPESLRALREAVRTAELGADPPRIGRLPMVKEGLEALARFQFGPEAASLLFAPPVRLEGRPWRQRLTDGGSTTLATWQEERGLFQLTVAGGQRLLAARVLWVEIDSGVSLTGDLFAPGVRAADPGIRRGDAVVLTREGELVGVGEAELPGPLMTDLHRGRAVAVRHPNFPRS